MEHRVLGGSGLAISAVGLGGVELCGGDATRGEPTLNEATVAVETAIDAGVNWIDTAESYHETRNEAFIGDVLRRVGPRLLVSTKLAPRRTGAAFAGTRCMQPVARASRGSDANRSMSTFFTIQTTRAYRSKRRGTR
jgi:aryl-alcohol dehydrogenase-like predicted oxidoreductase